MIDTASETLIPLREVPRLLPCRPNGKTIHISAVYRWAQRGVRRVRLEVLRIGGTTYTTREALQRFAEHLTGCPDQAEIPVRPTTRTRQRQIDRAAGRLDELLAPTRRRPTTGLVPPPPAKADRR